MTSFAVSGEPRLLGRPESPRLDPEASRTLRRPDTQSKVAVPETVGKHAEKLGLELTHEEGPGAHEWGYWDQQIQKALAWLPLSGKA